MSVYVVSSRSSIIEMVNWLGVALLRVDTKNTHCSRRRLLYWRNRYLAHPVPPPAAYSLAKRIFSIYFWHVQSPVPILIVLCCCSTQPPYGTPINVRTMHRRVPSTLPACRSMSVRFVSTSRLNRHPPTERVRTSLVLLDRRILNGLRDVPHQLEEIGMSPRSTQKQQMTTTTGLLLFASFCHGKYNESNIC